METPNPRRNPTTWVVVADSQQARIYDCIRSVRRVQLEGGNIHHLYDEKASHDLIPVLNGTVTADSIDGYQIGHDRRGTSSSSNSSAHNTYEPHGDITTELTRRYIKSVAEKLQKAYQEKLFHDLVLVAPAHMMGQLKQHLPAALQKQVVASLSKDLMQYQGQMLKDHLHDTLVEAWKAA